MSFTGILHLFFILDASCDTIRFIHALNCVTDVLHAGVWHPYKEGVRSKCGTWRIKPYSSLSIS